MTLCFVVFTMILGTVSMSAQSNVEINSLASKKTQELKKVVKFNSDTEELVYQTYQAFEQKKYKVDKVLAKGGTITAEEKEKINNMLTEKFKTIFSAEEFERYLSYIENKN